jgi:outer membrane protein assembly factor BamB
MGGATLAGTDDGHLVVMQLDRPEKLLVLDPDGTVVLDQPADVYGGLAVAAGRILHGGERSRTVMRTLDGEEVWRTAPGYVPPVVVGLAPDAAWALVPADDGLAVLRGDDGVEQGRLRGAPTCALAVDPTGTWVATRHEDGTAQLWRTRDWTLVHTLDGLTRCGPLAFSPDGEHLATGIVVRPRGVAIWTTRTGVSEQSFEVSARDLVWGPGGLVATGYDGTIVLRP